MTQERSFINALDYATDCQYFCRELKDFNAIIFKDENAGKIRGEKYFCFKEKIFFFN